MESRPKQITAILRNTHKGVALVLVLCLLVLISGIAVAFFSSVSGEYLTAKSAASESSSKELADATVQLAMAQIRQATSQGSNICWSSQPGMIRTWGELSGSEGTSSSKKLGFYKLYSSGTMTVDATANSSFNPHDDIPAQTWASQPALYTDLNAPVVGTSGTAYPIVDPRAADATVGTNSLVEGFSIETNGTNSAPIASGHGANQAPMPVKWLYILRDGSLISPDIGSTGNSALFTTGTKSPTVTNPIVGRIAFWTDDETCKLNINTACGGTYWDNPMYTSDMELNFSRCKPIANEYNRYPGHPSTTSLLPVLWSFAGMNNPYDNLYPNISDDFPFNTNSNMQVTLSTTGSSAFSSLLQFSPRNVMGGSKMGSLATCGYGATSGTTAVYPDTDRLYATVDEALFGSVERLSANPMNAFSLTKDQLNKLRFFLSTSTRAPETNPFNQPKVGIWPIPQLTGTDYRSPSDRLIAFCSTLNSSVSSNGGNAYYFTRKNAQSATEDWTPRNDQIFDYLDKLLATPMPGFGRSLADRYTKIGDERILTLIYDYIRSTINLIDTSFGYTLDQHDQSTDRRFSNNRLYNHTFMGVANNARCLGYGQVVPIQINKGNTTFKGIGRFPLIKEVALVFIAQAANQPPLVCTPDNKPIIYPSNSSTNAVITGTAVDTKYQNIDGTLTSDGLTLVLSSSAVAQINTTHPWTGGNYAAGNTISQFKDAAGHPVLAVDTSKPKSDPSAYFPIFSSTFGSTSGTVNVISSGTVAFIANQYPTLYATTGTSAYWGIVASTATNVVTSSGTFAFSVAATSSTNSVLNLPQTHAGMPYLTVQDPGSGAFHIKNPRYQGKDTSSAHELPDPANLPYGATQIQMAVIVDPVNVANGITGIQPKYKVEIVGLNNFRADGQAMFSGTNNLVQSSMLMNTSTPTFRYNLAFTTLSLGGYNDNIGGFYSFTGPRRTGGTNACKFNWISNNSPKVMNPGSFAFTGTQLTLNLYASIVSDSYDKTNDITTSGVTVVPGTVQTYNIRFPDATFPTPLLPPMPAGYGGNTAASSPLIRTGSTGSTYSVNNVPRNVGDLVPSNLLTGDPSSSLALNGNYGVGNNMNLPGTNGMETCVYSTSGTCIKGIPACRFYYGSGESADGCYLQYFLPERNGTDQRAKLTCDTIRSVECLYGDPRVLASLPVVPESFFAPHRFYNEISMRPAHTLRGIVTSYPDGFQNAGSNCRGATDHGLNDAYINNANWNYNALSGSEVGRTPGDPATLSGMMSLMGGLNSNSQWTGLTSLSPFVTSSCEFKDSIFASITGWSGKTRFSTVWGAGGDFSNAVGSEADGPYINKPNEAGGLVNVGAGRDLNYYPEWWEYNGSEGLSLSSQFSPNRLIASPVAFGGLPAPSALNPNPESPSAVDAWHTLLFCPNPNASTPAVYSTRMSATDVTATGQSPSGAKCPDHLILDFFNMPVVEPYAISEPFSTAGKVNMNYQIAPFTYIKRDTALRGVLAGTMVTAVNDQFVSSQTGNKNSSYKSVNGFIGSGGLTYATSGDNYGAFVRGTSGHWGFRYPIHSGETLKQFQQRFDNGDIFRSPSEICSLFLYPAKQPTTANPSNPGTALVSWDAANANILSWWYDNPGVSRKSLTGDNMRERPYDSLYPRLTTKSNSYTVHFRVQVLKQNVTSTATAWIENPTRIVSEYRGATLIERYIDPNDPNLPDFATATNDTLDNYYKFRIVNTKKFTAE